MPKRPGGGGKRSRGRSIPAARKYDLFVVTEGRVTEVEYLTYWAREHRRHINMRIEGLGHSPLRLVKRAVEEKKLDEQDERRRRGRARDEYWCVFDVDEHRDLLPALDLAQSKGIHVGVSNPCFELWLLLHYREQSAFIDRHQVQSLAKKIVSDGKRLTSNALEDLADNHDLARSRAERLEEKHAGDGTRFPGNPSSSIWRLVETIQRNS